MTCTDFHFSVMLVMRYTTVIGKTSEISLIHYRTSRRGFEIELRVFQWRL